MNSEKKYFAFKNIDSPLKSTDVFIVSGPYLIRDDQNRWEYSGGIEGDFWTVTDELLKLPRSDLDNYYVAEYDGNFKGYHNCQRFGDSNIYFQCAVILNWKCNNLVRESNNLRLENVQLVALEDKVEGLTESMEKIIRKLRRIKGQVDTIESVLTNMSGAK